MSRVLRPSHRGVIREGGGGGLERVNILKNLNHSKGTWYQTQRPKSAFQSPKVPRPISC